MPLCGHTAKPCKVCHLRKYTRPKECCLAKKSTVTLARWLQGPWRNQFRSALYSLVHSSVRQSQAVLCPRHSEAWRRYNAAREHFLQQTPWEQSQH